jgi:NAD(P)-dependent dehydrogenase (short-subunit alcohol dehydrogenase family)
MSERRVLVTGASRGIGRAIALALAQDGFDVGLGYRSRHTEAEVVAEEIRRLGRGLRKRFLASCWVMVEPPCTTRPAVIFS